MSKLISIMLGISFLASCGEHTELEQPIVNEGEIVAVTKEIQVSVLPMQRVGGGFTRSASDKPEVGEAVTMIYRNDAATTRLAMTADESKINNAYVVQFNGTSPTSTVAWVSEDVKDPLINGVRITCNFAMTVGVKNRVYVIANRATAPTVGMTLAAFEAPVALAPATSIPATGIPRSAMQDVSWEVGAAAFDVFQLRSLLAKLKYGFDVDDGRYGGVDATRVILKGVPSGYSFYAPKPGDVAVRPAGISYNDITLDHIHGGSYVHYVPENLSGRNSSLTHAYQRAVSAAPVNSIYLEADLDLGDIQSQSVVVERITCSLLLGDSSASDFNFVGGCYYDIYAIIAGVETTDLRIKLQ